MPFANLGHIVENQGEHHWCSHGSCGLGCWNNTNLHGPCFSFKSPQTCTEYCLCEVGKTFPGGRRVLHGINQCFEQGEVVSIRGDNGTGKTTLLNLIAGIDAPTEGDIRYEGLNGNKPRVGYTQQDYTSSLLPWFDVLENIAVPLRLTGIVASERRAQAEQLLESLGFNHLPGTDYPHQLSGGQKQRVGIARALIHEPHLLLLDEPFANLDARTSRELQETLSRIHSSSGTTIIYVSHELDHSIYLADRVLLLHGSPATIVREFAVPLERPRRREMILSTEFSEVRSEILAEEEALYAMGVT